MGPSISLDLKVDDVIAYNLHVLKTSEASRKQIRRAQLLLSAMALLVLVFSLLEVALRMTGALVMVAGCIALLVWIVLLPRLAAWGPPTDQANLRQRRGCRPHGGAIVGR